MFSAVRDLRGPGVDVTGRRVGPLFLEVGTSVHRVVVVSGNRTGDRSGTGGLGVDGVDVLPTYEPGRMSHTDNCLLSYLFFRTGQDFRKPIPRGWGRGPGLVVHWDSTAL